MHSTFLPLLLSLSYLGLVAGGCAPHWCSQHGLCLGSASESYCFCEYGFTGSDCARRICPKSFDPLKEGSYRTITIATAAARGMLSGEFGFGFMGEEFNFQATSKADALASNLNALPNVSQHIGHIAAHSRT